MSTREPLEPVLEYGLEANMRSRRNLRSDQLLRGDFCGLGGEPCSWQAEQRHTLEGRLEVLLRESSQVLLDE